MRAAICTLFEGDYHYGVGALANSLSRVGYDGVIWAGYRGRLPEWAKEGRDCRGSREVLVGACSVRFLETEASQHFANFKPDFMLSVLNEHARECDSLHYFDPDIVVRCRWSFFQEWAQCGIALCEDINSPMPETHPIRVAWRRLCRDAGMSLSPRTSLYVNSGFVGIARPYVGFLERWKAIQSLVNDHLNGGHPWHESWAKDRTDPLFRPDQDALNMTIEATCEPISLVGREGMSFSAGGYIMNHAIGPSKPWRRRFIWEALRGCPPSEVDRTFLSCADTPICLYPAGVLRRRRRELKIAAGIGRFIRRSG